MTAYKPTTAFWKIDKHIKEGIEKYNQLEKSTGKKQKKVFIIQGGAGAGKTISLAMMIIDLFNHTENMLRVTVASEELTKMRETVVMDFQNIMTDWGKYNHNQWQDQKARYNYNLQRFIEFKGLDKKDVGKGRRREIVYINEANKTTLDKYEDITLRANISILDFNPDKRFYAHDLINDFNFINLTFEDNEFIPDQEKNNILDYKRKGYNDDGSIKSEYYANKWRIYGMGEIGGVEGRIYYWQKCTNEEYFNLESTEYIGCDWGKVDPFAVIGVKYHDGRLLVHEYNYDSENIIQSRLSSTLSQQIEEAIVPYIFTKAGIEKDKKIITDTNYPTKLKSLWDNGWDYAQGVKNKWKIIERIAGLQELEVFYTESSKNIENEQYESCWKKDRAGNTVEEREDVNNHTLDAIEYVYIYLKLNGII